MSIVKLDHVSILARDAAAVIDFYRRVLGFEVARTRDIPALSMVIHDLEARGDHLEVIQPTGEKPPPDGLKHVAFFSDSIDADFEECRRRGATLVYDSVQRFDDIACFFMKGAAGELVEIIQHGTGGR